jgi:starch phosphorylase
MAPLEGKFARLPQRLIRLGELAFNLWWSWHPEARAIFHMLEGHGAECRPFNPVKILHDLDDQVLEKVARDTRFLKHYDAVMARFDAEMDAYGSWFNSRIADPGRLQIAYFSAEYGLHHSLPFYAGGLGFLAGDFLKECSDLGVPMVGLGFMYPEGYLRQKLSAKAQVGRVPLYLIDTDIEGNDPWNGGMSARLYTGETEQRLVQEIILGIGGIQILKLLGIRHSILHLNEGHSAFAILEMIREKVKNGMSFKDASEEVKASTVFTTHTPVATGHDVFPFGLMDKYFSSYIPLLGLDRDSFYKLGIDPKDSMAGFNMTAFALRMSAYCNCVSKKHEEVTRKIWQLLWPDLPENKLPLNYITNGVHLSTWIDHRMSALFNKYLGPNWLADQDNSFIWELIDDIPDEELWRTHQLLKMIMIASVQERARLRWQEDQADPIIMMASGVMLDPNALTIGFARRFATYKRAALIFQDAERLKRILTNQKKPVQIIFAGKAHTSDFSGKVLIQQIFNAARNPSFGARIAFVEDYDEEIAQYLVHGVDLWLNTPLSPFEASGTSGMKAEINGNPQLSVLDGWWLEGSNGKNGWAFGGEGNGNTDSRDAQELYTILEKEIVPLYYQKDEAGVPHDWIRVMKESIKSTAPVFSSRRMVKEYALKFYRGAMK